LAPVGSRKQLRLLSPGWHWVAAFALLVVAVAGLSSGRFLPSAQAECDAEGGPSVVPDKLDYLPGEIAQLDGCGFEAYEGQDLTLSIRQPDFTYYTDLVTIVDGGFLYGYTIPSTSSTSCRG
jgi:hypothetical protein